MTSPALTLTTWTDHSAADMQRHFEKALALCLSCDSSINLKLQSLQITTKMAFPPQPPATSGGIAGKITAWRIIWNWEMAAEKGLSSHFLCYLPAFDCFHRKLFFLIRGQQAAHLLYLCVTCSFDPTKTTI